MTYTRKVWKYELPIQDEAIKLKLSSQCELLSVVSHDDKIFSYFLMPEDTTNMGEIFTFYIFGTGHPIHLDMALHSHVATVTTHGKFWWHVFRRNLWEWEERPGHAR